MKWATINLTEVAVIAKKEEKNTSLHDFLYSCIVSLFQKSYIS